MSEQKSQTFRVGQTVEIGYRARVAEVITGATDGGPVLRLEAIDSADHKSPPGGWFSPADVDITVVDSDWMEPGLYVLEVEAKEQTHMGDFHTDGYEFFYFNTQRKWVDIGYGTPFTSEGLVQWSPPPF